MSGAAHELAQLFHSANAASRLIHPPQNIISINLAYAHGRRSPSAIVLSRFQGQPRGRISVARKFGPALDVNHASPKQATVSLRMSSRLAGPGASALLVAVVRLATSETQLADIFALERPLLVQLRQLAEFIRPPFLTTQRGRPVCELMGAAAWLELRSGVRTRLSQSCLSCRARS